MTFDSFTVPTKDWHRLDDGRLQCDVCPRAPVPEPNPNGKIKDKGCGAAAGHGLFGNPVLTDIFLKR